MRGWADGQCELVCGELLILGEISNSPHTGQPAISLPNGFNKAGLPLAIQLVGRPGDEAGIIALTAEFERARSWAGQASSDGALKVCC